MTLVPSPRPCHRVASIQNQACSGATLSVSLSPVVYRLRVNSVVAVRILPEATTEACVASQLDFGCALDQTDQASMDLLVLAQHVRKRQIVFPLHHQIVEGIDPVHHK